MGKWYVENDGRKYEWVEVSKEKEISENDLLDIEKVDRGYMVAVLAAVVFINSCVTTALFIGIIRTIALRINPAVPVSWLVPELQAMATIGAAWLVVIQCLLISVHARIGSLIANYEQ